MKRSFFILFFISLTGQFTAQVKTLEVFFENNSSNLNSAIKKQIIQLETDQKNDLIKIEKIIAYCDTNGSVEFNNKLANQRLNSVSKLLKTSATQIAAGETYPLNSHDPNDLKYWRRVDIQYIQKSSSQNPASVSDSTNRFLAIKVDSSSLAKSQPIVLNIQFYPGLTMLYGNSMNEIDNLFQFLIINPNVDVFIRGHVCCDNSYELSFERAKAVFAILLDRGIEEERMRFEGFSNFLPAVYPEITPEDQQRNRRVDVIFTLKK